MYYLTNIYMLCLAILALLSSRMATGQLLVFDKTSIAFGDLGNIMPVTVNIKLSVQPVGSVFVRIIIPPSQFYTATCNLVFTRDNWNVNQQISVAIQGFYQPGIVSSSVIFNIDAQTLTSNTCQQSSDTISLTYDSRLGKAGYFSGTGALQSFDGEITTFQPAAAGMFYVIKSNRFGMQVKMQICNVATSDYCVTELHVRYYDSTYKFVIDPASGAILSDTVNNPSFPSFVKIPAGTMTNFVFDDNSLGFGISDYSVGSGYFAIFTSFSIQGSFMTRISGFTGNFDGTKVSDAQYLTDLQANPPLVPDSDKISLCGVCSNSIYSRAKCSSAATVPAGFCAALFTTTTTTTTTTSTPTPTPPSPPGPIVIPDPPINVNPPVIDPPPFTVPDQPVIPPPTSTIISPPVPTPPISSSLIPPSPTPSQTPAPAETVLQLGIPPVPIKPGSGFWNIKSVQKTRAKISKVGLNELQVTFPANCGAPTNKKCGPESGMSFFAMPEGYSASESLTMTYDAFFPTDFDFENSGMLPGMSIGAASGSNGGSWTRNSGAARLIWQSTKGKQPSLNPFFNFPTEVSKVTQTSKIGMKPKIGDWNTISMSVKLNTLGRKDGSMTFTLNGVSKIQKNLTFRKSKKLNINGLAMTSWFGSATGGDIATFGNQKAQAIKFRNFTVKKK